MHNHQRFQINSRRSESEFSLSFSWNVNLPLCLAIFKLVSLLFPASVNEPLLFYDNRKLDIFYKPEMHQKELLMPNSAFNYKCEM